MEPRESLAYDEFANNLLMIARAKMSDPLSSQKDSTSPFILQATHALTKKPIYDTLMANYYGRPEYSSDTIQPWLTNDFSVFTNTVDVSGFTFFSGNPPFIVSNTLFKENCSFTHNDFASDILFSNCYFQGACMMFDKDSIKKALSFSSCFFLRGLRFNDSLSVDWRHPEIKNLISEMFDNDVLFTDCKIYGQLSFRGCTFTENSHLVFYNCILPDTLILNGITTENVIDLTRASANDNQACYLNIGRMDIKKIKMQYNNFKLIFDEAMSQDEKSSVYELLLQNFKENGFNESYRKLDIEYKDYQAENDILMKVNKYWWQYGYAKGRVLLWTLVIILTFSLLNYLKFSKIIETYKVEKINFNHLPYATRKKFIRKYLLVLFYTGFIFFKLGIDFNKIDFSRIYTATFIIFQYVIGLICTGFIINYFIKV